MVGGDNITELDAATLTDVMNDTSDHAARLIAERYRALDGATRMRIAAEMFDTARALVLATLPPAASEAERRRHLLRRFYPELVARVPF